MMYRSSVMDGVSTFKIYIIPTLVKNSLGSQLVTSAAVHGVEINICGAVIFTFLLLQPQEQRSLRLPQGWKPGKAWSWLQPHCSRDTVKFFKLMAAKSAQGSQH
jgi:hypothetical protein